jgi:hypothetical protein
VVIQISFAEVGGGALLGGQTFVRYMLRTLHVDCMLEGMSPQVRAVTGGFGWALVVVRVYRNGPAS